VIEISAKRISPFRSSTCFGETTPQEKAEADARAKFFDLMKANPGKSEAEIRGLSNKEKV
jgi:hypothetical protein